MPGPQPRQNSWPPALVKVVDSKGPYRAKAVITSPLPPPPVQTLRENLSIPRLPRHLATVKDDLTESFPSLPLKEMPSKQRFCSESSTNRGALGSQEGDVFRSVFH